MARLAGRSYLTVVRAETYARPLFVERAPNGHKRP